MPKPTIISALLSVFFASTVKASELFLTAGICYEPVAKLDYTLRSDAKIEFYDNIKYEMGAIYLLPSGFGFGFNWSYLSKGINPGGNTHSDLTLWNLALIANYGYAFTESGKALIILGAESDYGRLYDDGGYGTNSASGLGIAGIMGWRYRISTKWFVEFDYRFAQQEFSFDNDPPRDYEFSDSTIRLTIFFSLLNFAN